VRAARFEARKGQIVVASLAGIALVVASVTGVGYLRNARTAAANEGKARILAEERARDANQLASTKAELAKRAEEEKKREGELRGWYQEELDKLQKDVTALQKQANELQGTKDPERIKALVNAVSKLKSGGKSTKGAASTASSAESNAMTGSKVGAPTVFIPPPD